MFSNGENTKEVTLKNDFAFYQLLFWLLVSTVPLKNIDGLDSINQTITEHEDNPEVVDFTTDSNNLIFIVKSYISQYKCVDGPNGRRLI